MEQRFYPQNDKVLAANSEDVSEDMLTVYRPQKLASVMVWAAVSKTWKLLLIFVKQGVKVNTNVYIDDTLAPAFRDMEESTSKIKILSSNRTVLPLTPPTKLKL